MDDHIENRPGRLDNEPAYPCVKEAMRFRHMDLFCLQVCMYGVVRNPFPYSLFLQILD